MEEAIRLRDDGRLGEAEQILVELSEQYPEDLAIVLVRAGILFTLRKFASSSLLFQRVASEKPFRVGIEGLFHSLWKLGEHDRAFDEMRRFLSFSDSEDYRQLLSDMMADLKE